MSEIPSRLIGRDFHRLKMAAARLEKYLKLTAEGMMAGIEELQSKINELQQAVSDDEANDAEVVARLNVTIQDLQDQVAAGQPVDTQPLIDQLQAIKDSLVPAEQPVQPETPIEPPTEPPVVPG
jgi:predicted HAD superfamily Cof-like phosphohydrolase